MVMDQALDKEKNLCILKKYTACDACLMQAPCNTLPVKGCIRVIDIYDIYSTATINTLLLDHTVPMA